MNTSIKVNAKSKKILKNKISKTLGHYERIKYISNDKRRKRRNLCQRNRKYFQQKSQKKIFINLKKVQKNIRIIGNTKFK